MNLKLKLKNKLVPNLLLCLTQKKKIFYIPPFKRNIEELKANITRLKENFEFVPTCHHCHIVSHIRPNCPKLMSLSNPRLYLLLENLIVLKLLMFVTIVVLPVTLVLIISSYFLISECLIGLILCLKALCLFLMSY